MIITLTVKTEWSWGEEEQKAFDKLKKWIMEDVVLAIPIDGNQFCVEADSLDYANGVVLSQKIDRKWGHQEKQP